MKVRYNYVYDINYDVSHRGYSNLVKTTRNLDTGQASEGNEI